MLSQVKQMMMCLALGMIVILANATAGQTQGRFSPVLQVGDGIVTRYELDQRTRFLALLNAPGDPRNLAREQLINESIQMSAARSAGMAPSEDLIEQGMAEFAGRAELTAEEFVTALGENGVDASTFRDFIAAGVAWRDYVRETFADTAREIPQDIIRRTLARTGTEGGLRVLVSEVLLPANTPESAAASRARAADISAFSSETAFSAAAREVSIAPSSARGGELNWVDLDSLPDRVRGPISRLTPGQITRPIELENGIGVFLLRDVERVAAGTPETLDVDYALFITDGDRTVADAIAARVDVCDDLYGVAQGLPEDRLIRETRPASALAPDIRTALSNLDADESTTALTRSGKSTVLMLCDRRPALESSVDLDLVGNRLLNQKLGVIAADHLTELRANTIIVDLQ